MKRSWFPIVLFASILIPAATFAQSTPADPHWSSTGSAGTPRYLHTTTPLLDGRVLIAGGTTKNDVATARCEVYDPAKGSFSATGRLKMGRFGGTATLLSDGRVLVAGGAGSPQLVTSGACELYNPATGSWTETGALKSVNPAFAIRLGNGKVLAVGGSQGGCDLFDPATGVWTAGPSLPVAEWSWRSTPDAGIGLTLLPNGNVFYLLQTGKCEIYNPFSNSWSIGSDLATLLSRVISLADGSVLALAGDGITCYRYSALSGTWSLAGSLRERRAFHSATLMPDGKVLIAGGAFGYPYTPTTTCELYDPATGTSSYTTSLTTARWRQAAVRLNSGQVLAIGGDRAWTQSSMTSMTCELYTP